MKLRLTYTQGEIKIYSQSDFNKEDAKEIKIEEFLNGLSPEFREYSQCLFSYVKTSMEKIHNNHKHTTPKLEMIVELSMEMRKNDNN